MRKIDVDFCLTWHHCFTENFHEVNEMYTIYLKNCVVGNATVELEFFLSDNGWGLEPNYDIMSVWYLAPTDTPEEKRWVNIVDTLADFVEIDKQLQERWVEVMRQFQDAADDDYDGGM